MIRNSLFVRGSIVAFVAMLLFSTHAKSEDPTEPSPYTALFQEQILTVSEARDGDFPKNLRHILRQAQQIRNQNSFTKIKIIFAENIPKISIQEALPAFKSSLTTLDCAQGSHSVLIQFEGTPKNSDGIDIASDNNEIRSCRFAGFARAITLQPHTNYNRLIGNHFSKNDAPSIELLNEVGKENHFSQNSFDQVSPTPLKNPQSQAHITKIHKAEIAKDVLLVSGSSLNSSFVEIVAFDPKTHQMGPSLGHVTSNANGKFKLKINASNIPGIVALGRDGQNNTGEFSAPYLFNSIDPLENNPRPSLKNSGILPDYDPKNQEDSANIPASSKIPIKPSKMIHLEELEGR